MYLERLRLSRAISQTAISRRVVATSVKTSTSQTHTLTRFSLSLSLSLSRFATSIEFGPKLSAPAVRNQLLIGKWLEAPATLRSTPPLQRGTESRSDDAPITTPPPLHYFSLPRSAPFERRQNEALYITHLHPLPTSEHPLSLSEVYKWRLCFST